MLHPERDDEEHHDLHRTGRALAADQRTAGLIPLSVATDRIGLTAIRAARLQTLPAACGHDVDRSGTGLIVETQAEEQSTPARGDRCEPSDPGHHLEDHGCRPDVLPALNKAA